MSRRGNPRVFARNLKLLTIMCGFSNNTAAESISKKYGVKISPRWYRALCNEGVGQSHQKTEAKLRAIADHFGIRILNHLWKPDLIMFRLSYDLVPPTHAEYTVRFAELLESGKHDYLCELIVRLHEAEFGPGGSPGRDEEPKKDDDRYFTPEYKYRGGLDAVEGEGVSYQLEPEEPQSEEAQEDDLLDQEAD